MKSYRRLLIVCSLICILFLALSSASANELDDGLSVCDSSSSQSDDGSVSSSDLCISNGDSYITISDISSESAMGPDAKNRLQSARQYASTLSDGTFEDIQKAVDDANENDEIFLKGSFSGSGNLIVINKTITISGSPKAILDANNLSKVFLVEANDVTFRNLEIVNGKSRNSSDAGPYQGTVNWQGSGGSIIDCSFVNNSGDEKSYGASLYWKGSDGQIIDCEFINSHSGANGGAIFALGDNFLINGSRFIGNHGKDGGAVYFGGSASMRILNCLFVNNSASLGGALAACAMDRIVSNSSFINNSAESGGAISWCGSKGLIANSSFINNSASLKGGSIIFTGSNNLVRNSIFANNSAADGGAIHSYRKTNYMNSLTFLNNTSSSGDCYGDMEVKRFISSLIVRNMSTSAIDSKIDGRKGEYFNVTLKDQDGNPLSGKTIKIGFNGRIYNKTTDADGKTSLQINLKYAGTYTFAICFLGDDDFYASFDVAKISVNKQNAILTASDFKYKSSAKTKTISAVLKTSRGNAIYGKTVTFTINSKVYTAKTNSNGVASINVSLSSKKTYGFSVKYAGDSTYAALSKSAKLVIY